METRFKFAGNVGQVIGGSATFAAPHTFNQTNNVTVTAQALDQRPLLLRHRVSISKRVDQIAATEGIPSETIYRVLLEDYGGESIKDMARGNYRSIVADLDEWIGHMGEDGPAADAAGHKVNPRTIDCKASRWRGRIALGSVAGIAVGALLLAGLELRDDPPRHCQWDGKEYSVGSVATMATADVYECAFTPEGYEHPQWIPARNLGGAGAQQR